MCTRMVRLAAGATALAFALAGLVVFPRVAKAADGGRGKDLFDRRCGGCHSLDKEKEGPRLRGVYGRRSGTVPTFAYSDALKNARVTWDAASLDRWLADPDEFLPDANMAFRLPKPDERAAIIAYLQQASGKQTLRRSPRSRLLQRCRHRPVQIRRHLRQPLRVVH